MPEPARAAPPGILSCPPEREAEALARLRPGLLWEAFLPGTDQAGILALLGDGGISVLEAAIRHVPGQQAILRSCGYPFPPPTPDILARAMLDDGARVPAATPGRVGRLDHGPRQRWTRIAGECVDHAARLAVSGVALDPLDALVSCPSGDLLAAVALADADARERFAAGLEIAAGDLGSFARGYFRCSAVAGLLQSVRNWLEDAPGGVTGRDESGWPVWWEPDADGVAAFDAVVEEAATDRGHAVLATPEQAAALVPDWPSGLWLVAMRGRDGIDRWEAAAGDELPDVLSGLPAWPPLDGMDVARIDAVEEIRLLGRIATEPGIGVAAASRAKAGSPHAKEISADDIDW